MLGGSIPAVVFGDPHRALPGGPSQAVLPAGRMEVAPGKSHGASHPQGLEEAPSPCPLPSCSPCTGGAGLGCAQLCQTEQSWGQACFLPLGPVGQDLPGTSAPPDSSGFPMGCCLLEAALGKRGAGDEALTCTGSRGVFSRACVHGGARADLALERDSQSSPVPSRSATG